MPAQNPDRKTAGAPARIPTGSIEVIAPNLKRRLSGVTSTIVRLVPIQAEQMGVVATGPGLPDYLPHIALWKLPFLSRRTRVWHARRNVEMLLGLVLKNLFRSKLKLLFTSASQRQHSGYTKWLISRMDAVIATSHKTQSYLECDATVSHHGINTDDFQPAGDRTALRQKLGLPDDVLIGCYGRIRHQKGTDAFVDAMIRILPDLPGHTALVMGRATEKHTAFLDGLKKRVAAEGLAERILFLPEVPVHQVAAWYQVLDLFVAPQRWEGFGLTPLEAMACGVPCVATRVGAFEELLADGAVGTLVARDDVAALAEASMAWLADPERMVAGASAARAHVLAHFRIEGEAERLIAIYRDLLEQA
ncbi:glycosyltransferase family 4 protein [Candidatus Halocynthiibacter alkanivorans]|uniref:glycosyltransferase family 4 protein n=1 Tax=Candidatus Halocynthiibacter alkanivorans TaxID=2267619 RepID=UPI000DF11E37|nr:glycosyltransferase family 4 protein [Candidatus Halocynthiibacter alkanivorans]